MQLTLQPNGRILMYDQSNNWYEVGPEHPDYGYYRAQIPQAPAAWPAAQPKPRPQPSPWRGRLLGAVLFLGGIGGWWYNSYTAMTSHTFYLKLTIIAPTMIVAGLVTMIRPEWSGPIRKDSTLGHKLALGAVIVLGLGAGLADYLALKQGYVLLKYLR